MRLKVEVSRSDDVDCRRAIGPIWSISRSRKVAGGSVEPWALLGQVKVMPVEVPQRPLADSRLAIVNRQRR